MKLWLLLSTVVLAAALSAGPTYPVAAASGKQIIVTSPLGSGSVTLMREGPCIIVSIDDVAFPAKEAVVDLVADVGPFHLVEATTSS